MSSFPLWVIICITFDNGGCQTSSCVISQNSFIIRLSALFPVWLFCSKYNSAIEMWRLILLPEKFYSTKRLRENNGNVFRQYGTSVFLIFFFFFQWKGRANKKHLLSNCTNIKYMHKNMFKGERYFFFILCGNFL